MKIERNNIYLIDCLKGMGFMRNKSVDMILCDLPYGVLKTEHTAWDIRLPFDQLWKQYTRIIKANGVVVLTCTHPFTNDLINLSC